MNASQPKQINENPSDSVGGLCFDIIQRSNEGINRLVDSILKVRSGEMTTKEADSVRREVNRQTRANNAALRAAKAALREAKEAEKC